MCTRHNIRNPGRNQFRRCRLGFVGYLWGLSGVYHASDTISLGGRLQNIHR